MLPIETIIAQGEGETLEFKPSFNQDVIESAVALANTRGGRILIGVSNTSALIGTSFSQEAFRDGVNRISNATEPSVIPYAEKLSLPDGDVLVFTVPEFPLKPVAVRGRCFKRSGSTTRQMTPSEIAEVHLQCTGQSPDALLVDGKTVADLDLNRVHLYMTRAINSGRRSFSENDDPLAILQKLELIRSEQEVTRGSLFLFGKNPQSPFQQAVVHAGRIRGHTEIMDDRFIRGSIIEQVEESLDFIKKHINVKSVISGKSRRDDIWDYPLTALREGLTNAICHRDYGDLADIQIKIYDQSLQIWSPGFLPFGMTVEELLRPNHSSKPRNRLIAQAFYDMGLIEQYGSGIERVVNACVKAGFPAPKFENFSGGFQIVFTPLSVLVAQGGGSVDWSETERKIVGLLADKPLGRKGLLTGLGYTRKTGNFVKAVEKLLAQGVVEMTLPEEPNSRFQEYHLIEKRSVGVPVEVPVDWSETERKIVGLLTEEPLGRKGLLAGLGYARKTGNFVKALEKLLTQGVVEMTLPEKPNSRFQKYRLTEKGKRVLRTAEVD